MNTFYIKDLVLYKYFIVYAKYVFLIVCHLFVLKTLLLDGEQINQK